MRAKILVTGGDGMLGHALRKVCPEATFVSRQEADLRDLSQVERIFEKYKPEAVLHCAAIVGGVQANAERNADFFTDNIQINTNVLSVAARHRVMRLLSLLSSCAFQTYAERASTEDDLHQGVPFEGDRGYAYSKRMLDIQTQLIWKQDGLRFSTVTPVTMYGPHDDWDLENSHVLSALIYKCFLAKRDSKPLTVWGSGKAVRQFVFVEDVARFLTRVLEKIEGPDTLILAPDQGISIRELAEGIAREMHFEGPIEYDRSKPEGQLHKVLESKKFSKKFPEFNFTPFHKGLKETIAWFEGELKVQK